MCGGGGRWVRGTGRGIEKSYCISKHFLTELNGPTDRYVPFACEYFIAVAAEIVVS